VKLRPPTNDFAARTDGSRRGEQVADELDAMDVALPHSLRAPNVGLKAASHPLSIQSSLANNGRRLRSVGFATLEQIVLLVTMPLQIRAKSAVLSFSIGLG
jgi:hypothetical protein